MYNFQCSTEKTLQRDKPRGPSGGKIGFLFWKQLGKGLYSQRNRLLSNKIINRRPIFALFIDEVLPLGIENSPQNRCFRGIEPINRENIALLFLDL